MHCVSMHIHSVCNNELMEHRGSCHCCRKCPNCYDYTLLLRLFFRLYALFHNEKSHFWVGFHCRLQANRSIHHGRTVFVACRSMSGVDSIRDHEGVFSRYNTDIGRTFLLLVHTTDVGNPTGTHGRTKLIAQVINGLGNGLPLVRPHVVCKSQILTNLQ